MTQPRFEDLSLGMKVAVRLLQLLILAVVFGFMVSILGGVIALVVLLAIHAPIALIGALLIVLILMAAR
ncbi:hypothetical protein ACQPZJ_35380 [Actinoplanes sp. CA-054009]